MTERFERVKEAFTPKPLPRRDYLFTNIIVNGVIAVLVVAIVGALAISRASHHRLSGVAVAVILAMGAALSAAYASVTGVHTGILDTTAGLVLDDDNSPMAASATSDGGGSAMGAGDLWRRAALGAAAALVWAGGLGLLLAAVINGRVVGYPLLLVALLVSNLLGGATAGAVATARGIATVARTRAGQPRPLRTRAWRDVAPLLATVAFIGATGFSVLLFHDYRTGVTTGAHALTRTELFKDVLITLTINGALMAYVAGRAGRAEAALGLVDFDDAATQRPPGKALFSRNAIGWTVFALFIVISAAKSLMPSTPSLLAVALTRATYSSAVAYIAAGLGYVRGAANTLGTVETFIAEAGVPA